MKLGDHLHLTYCLNVHTGESWNEQKCAIEEKTSAVRSLIGSEAKPFGLGLRLGAAAAEDLRSRSDARAARSWLEERGFYVFTINGFPYGRFHGQSIKQSVYSPDWQSEERRDYTILLADILGELLPEGQTGSISTVPGSFAEWISSPHQISRMVERLCQCIAHLDRLRATRGVEIHIGLEPEPSCFLETCSQTIEFFEQAILPEGSEMLASLMGASRSTAEKAIRRHLGVCFDTCHSAVVFEDAETAISRYQQAGIKISKVQISAALSATPNHNAELARFAEPTYLHQVRGKTKEGEIVHWLDLPGYLAKSPRDLEEIRVHFHVPLFADSPGGLTSTAKFLTPSVFDSMSRATNHWEIETYTFDVFPNFLRSNSIEQSIAAEYAWVIDKFSEGRRHRGAD